MRPLALEARVLAAVDARRSGTSPEDDFTECKREWPEPKAAKQLAALANRAAGEPIVYIVGMDDTTGEVVNPGSTDPADWWGAIQKEFDEVAPDWLLHMTVAVADREYVHAVAFDTSRVPYVVKTQNGRDVPMREGTRTRSASRRELLRLLLPSVRTPPATILDAHVSANRRAARQAEDSASGRTLAQPEEGYFGGNARVFLEHLGPGFVMLPMHGMRGWVQCEDWRGELLVDGRTGTTQPDTPVSAHGVEVRADGILATGPGAFSVFVQGGLPLYRGGMFVAAEHVELTLEFDVVGSRQPLRVGGRLLRRNRRRQRDSEYVKTLGTFELD